MSIAPTPSGQSAPTTGSYSCALCGVQVRMVRGSSLPACPVCARAVSWSPSVGLSSGALTLEALPSAREVAAPSAPFGSPLPSASRKARVLVVDDEPTIGDVLATALGRAGYDVRVAIDADLDGVDLAGTQLALVDMHLAGRDGLEVVRRVRRAAPSAVVVAMSGDSDFGRASRAGVSPHRDVDATLPKPFDIRSVTDLCSVLLARAAKRHGAPPAPAHGER